MKKQRISSYLATETKPYVRLHTSAALSRSFLQGRRRLWSTFCLVFIFTFFWAYGAIAESSYPDLRDVHDPELQKAMDKALGPSHPEFWSGVHKKEFSVVVADVTDLHHPHAAWYNPDLMLYAASLPKIAIVLGVLVEVDRGVIKLDSETRSQLIRMIRQSSTSLLRVCKNEKTMRSIANPEPGANFMPTAVWSNMTISLTSSSISITTRMPAVAPRRASGSSTT